MSYRAKRRRYKPSRYAAFGRIGRNVRKGTRVRRGDETYGGAVYRYTPQVAPRSADMKWLLWANDHQQAYPPGDLALSTYAWGASSQAYLTGSSLVSREYLGPVSQSKYVYLDDPWYCPLISTGGNIWSKRVSSAIMLKKMQCCFNVRPIQFQIPGLELGAGASSVNYAFGKQEVLVNGIFRWWLILDTQCNGTRLRDYVVGPYTGGLQTGSPNYIFDRGFGYCSTLNELNRGRFVIVAVKDFDVCGSIVTSVQNTGLAQPTAGLIYTFIPKSKQYDFSVDLNIPLEWSGFSANADDSDQTYTTNRLFMCGAYITGQGFHYRFQSNDAYTNEAVFVPWVDPAMFIKTYFIDI